MEDIVKKKLSENNELDKILSLNILYLKYKKVLETEDYRSLYVLKYLCYNHCFGEELKKINEHFKIEISVENPFNPIVLDELKNIRLIEFSTYANNKGDVCISNEGINYLKKYYKINDEGLSFTNMIVYNTINITNINITNTINNITNRLSDDDKDFFISILKEYSYKKDKNSFIEKLSNFSKRVGEEIFINVISNIFNPENISKILENIS